MERNEFLLHEGGAYGEMTVEHNGEEYFTSIYVLISFAGEEVDDIYDIQYHAPTYSVEKGAWYHVGNPEKKADKELYKTFEELARQKYIPNALPSFNFLNEK